MTDDQREARQELLDAGVSVGPAPRPAPRPAPLDSLIASARRLTQHTMAARAGGSSSTGQKTWQDDAWDMFDLVGELHFLAVTLAARMSQARLYVGRLGADPTVAPDPVDDADLNAVLESIGATAGQRAQLIQRLAVNLFVPGEGWLVGIPRYLIPPTLLIGTSLSVRDVPPLEPPPGVPPGTLRIEDLEWRMLSVREVTASSGGGEVQLRLGEGQEEILRVDPNLVVMIRVWRPHSKLWWEADSPVRASLPVLRELVGLTMHVSAEVDSRLAGAGLLIIPQSAKRALLLAAGLPEDSESDPFTESLIEAMVAPISDRASASAVVPLVIGVPDEAVEKFKFLDFSKPIDQFAGERRDEAIRRLALGLDAPPELLLGTGSMNHWGAWLVLEDVVTTHLEPPLALICDALTTQFLWPVMQESGFDPATLHDYVIWYDVSDLVIRPNRSSDAMALHDKKVISDAALRNAAGFDETDAPPRLPQEVELALAIVRQNPGLLSTLSLSDLVEQIRAVLTGQPAPASAAPAQTPPADGAPAAPAAPDAPGTSVPTGPPATEAAPAQIPASQAAGGAPPTLSFPVFVDDLPGRVMEAGAASAQPTSGGLLPDTAVINVYPAVDQTPTAPLGVSTEQLLAWGRAGGRRAREGRP